MMREVLLAASIALMAAGPALAQSAAGPAPRASTATHARRSSQTPLDKGPFTPEASRAFQGGGVILEGAPGAPAPRPTPTPPGQTPQNMVPPR